VKTKNNTDRVEEFLDLFCDVEKQLKKILGSIANPHANFGALLSQYEKKNTCWQESARRLRILADIRNILTHGRGLLDGYPIELKPKTLEDLRAIYEYLVRPETVASRYLKEVVTVDSETTLAEVLRLSFENGFSQFPVLSKDRFTGLITENEIVRWMGRKAVAGDHEVDLSAVTVKRLIHDKDPFLKNISVFRFARTSSSVHEVMSKFAIEPALEVVLLTSTGNKTRPIEGIVTQWDAARYVNPS
jgi:CBS domain-containing protein